MASRRMPTSKTPAIKVPAKATVEYEGLEKPPVYVEGVQGMKTPQGSFQVSFFSEYVKARPNLNVSMVEAARTEESVDMKLQAEDPFGVDKDRMVFVRRIEGTFIIPPAALRTIVTWLQLKLNELEKK